MQIKFQNLPKPYQNLNQYQLITLACNGDFKDQKRIGSCIFPNLQPHRQPNYLRRLA